MTEPERLHALCTLAFNYAMKGEMEEASATVGLIDKEGGESGAGVVELLVGLCDTLIIAMGIERGAVIEPVLIPMDGEVTEEDRWASAMVCARAADDEARFTELILEVPRDDPAAPWSYVRSLLLMVAFTVREIKAGQS